MAYAKGNGLHQEKSISQPHSPFYRLYVTSPLQEGGVIALDAGQINYLLTVLRMKAEDALLIFNGVDGEWMGVVETPTRKTALLRVQKQIRPQPMPSFISYAFAPLKAARLDYLVQKAVEMGASQLEPVITHRTQGGRLKLERIHANAIEAAEQCGILALPAILPEKKLEAWFHALHKQTLLIFCDEMAEIASPIAALEAHRAAIRAEGEAAKIIVLIGPEGGFTEQERGLLLTHPRVVRLSLGPRILRGDTAGVAAMALVQAVLGDFRAVQQAPPSHP